LWRATATRWLGLDPRDALFGLDDHPTVVARYGLDASSTEEKPSG